MGDTGTRSFMTGDDTPNFDATCKDMQSRRSWKLRVNDRNFSIFLFLLSLSVVIGKVCLNHSNLFTPNDLLPSMPEIPTVLNSLSLEKVTEFLNVSSRYEKSVSEGLLPLYAQCGWLIKAVVSGLLTMAFCWFIIYEDSSIPGVNPPFPLQGRFSERRLPINLNIQMNYLVGILYGILTFIYMCL